MNGTNDHIPALDGLRGLAIGTVMLSHYSNQTGLFGKFLGDGAGQIGVMLFFVLSGFLMARLCFDKPISPAATRAFYRRRIARIVPLFFFVVAFALFFFLLTGSGLPGLYVTTGNLLNNLLFLKGSGLLWTIAAEMQFYLIFPVVWLGHRAMGAWLCVPLIALMVIRTMLADAELFPVLYFGQFFCAGIVAHIVHQAIQRRPWPNWSFPLAFFLYILALPRVRSTLTPFDIARPDYWWAPEYYAIIPILLLAALLSPLGQKLLSLRPAQWLGKVSYSAYLWHWPILALVGATTFPHAVSFPVFGLAVAFISYLSYSMIEVPSRSYINGQNRLQKTALPI